MDTRASAVRALFNVAGHLLSAFFLTMAKANG